MLVDFQKRCFWDTLPLSVGPARCQTLTISGGSKTFFYFSSKKIFKGKKVCVTVAQKINLGRDFIYFSRNPKNARF